MLLMSMLRKSFRLIALICAGSIGVSSPVPAYALRPEKPSDSPIVRNQLLAGLEEKENILPIEEVAAALGIWKQELESYGSYIAKVRAREVLERLKNRQPGKLVIVTGITPTPAGEGKTTTSIGLLDGLSKIGVPAIAALREPSLGPVFGAKGGATGTGQAQLYPARRINLAFTGDFTAIADAHNLLVESFYNAIYWGYLPKELAQNPAISYVVDLNARTLRDIRIKVGKEQMIAEQSFILTPASEVMASLALAQDPEDLKARLGRIILAWDGDQPVQAIRLGNEVLDNMMALLAYAVMPNLVQSSEGNPVLVHAGPFANIAHGTSSVIATRLAEKLIGPDGVVVQETGFGSDLGLEKYMDVVAPQSGLRPNAVVLVASVRALKWHGGVSEKELTHPDVEALRRGLPNLDAHVGIIRSFGVPVVVALNVFKDDSVEELEAVRRHLESQGVSVAESRVVEKGGTGGMDLAHAVDEILQTAKADYHPLYSAEVPLEEKIRRIAIQVYGAHGAAFSNQAISDIAKMRKAGFGELPVIMVKTPASLSDNPQRRGVPKKWELDVRGITASPGAGFLRVYVGKAPPLLMPGLPEVLRALPPDGHTAGLEESGPPVSEVLTEQAFNQLKYFSGRMEAQGISWTDPVKIAGVWADVDRTLTHPDFWTNGLSPLMVQNYAWILQQGGSALFVSAAPYHVTDVLDPTFYFPASLDRRVVGRIREAVSSPADMKRLKVLGRSGGVQVGFSSTGEEKITLSPGLFSREEITTISKELAIAAFHAIRKGNADLSDEIAQLRKAEDVLSVARILRDVEQARGLVLLPGITPLEIDGGMIFVSFKDGALDSESILAEATPRVRGALPTRDLKFIRGPMYVAVSLFDKTETLRAALREADTRPGLLIVAGDGPKDDLPMLKMAADSSRLVLPYFVGPPEAVDSGDLVAVSRNRHYVQATEWFLDQAVTAAREGKPYADLPFVAGELTPRAVADALGIPLGRFSQEIQKRTYSGVEENGTLSTQPAAKTLLEFRPGFVPVPPHESGAPVGSDRFRTIDHVFQFAPMGDGMVLFADGAAEDQRLILEDRRDASHRSLVVHRGRERLFFWEGEPGNREVVVRGYEYDVPRRTLTVFLDRGQRPPLSPHVRQIKQSNAILRLEWAEPRPRVTELQNPFIQEGERNALDHSRGLHVYVTVDLQGNSRDLQELADETEAFHRAYGTDWIESSAVSDDVRNDLKESVGRQIQGRAVLVLEDPAKWKRWAPRWIIDRWAAVFPEGKPREFRMEPINLYLARPGGYQGIRFEGFVPLSEMEGKQNASVRLEFSNNGGRSWDWKTSIQTAPASAGLEETYFPPPRKVDSPPAAKIWEAGSDVLPSDDERLARMAFEAPRGGPRQYLRLFASLNIVLPAALRDERYGGRTLLSYLPDGATLNSGYINAIEEPFIRSRIRRLLTDQGPRVRARVHLGRVDVEIPMSPINVWVDGKIRYEGRVPAEDIRFHVDRSFTVEIYWNGQWHRLREEGRIRIEPPNPSQIAALSSPDDLGMGQHDAQEELRYARGLLAEPGDEETKQANEALLDAGIVTNQNLPPAQRAPYLGRLQSEGRLSPAEARKAFVAQQRAAFVQKDSFFEGMQFKLGVSPSGDRWLLMYNPNRANTPKPMPGAAHALSEDKPIQFKEPTGEVVTLRQRMLPVPTDRLDNPVKAKMNPYGYVWGHLTLPVTTQIAQSDWPEAIDAVVEQMWQQQSRLTVVGVNLGGKAAASLPDWAHAHDIPWRMPVDEVGDSEILWRSGEQGVRLGLLRDPFLMTFVFEGDQGSSAALVAQAKSLVARLKAEGFGDYNAWGVVRPDGIGRLFVLPRSPTEPDPPADAAEKKWKPADDYAKPIADQDYWSMELSPGQRRLMSRSEMEQAGMSTTKPPLVLKGRPVLDIKMGIMELRRFLLISNLAIYEDSDLEARLIKTFELVGVPWSDSRVRQILEGIPAAAEQLDEGSAQQVHRLTTEIGGIGSADRLVALFDAVSEWRHRHVDAFGRLASSEKSDFTATAERQIKHWITPDGLVREVPHAQGSVPTPDPAIPPILAVVLNPTLDRGIRVVESDGRNFLEVSRSAGGPGANLVQAASALGREAHLMGLFSGATGDLAIEALHDYGVAVHPIASSESQPDTRSSLMVASSRPGRRERRLVGEGAVTPAGLIQQVRSLLENEPWRDRRYSLVVGERWVGDSAPGVAGEAADLVRFVRGKGNEVHITVNSSWTPEIWETMLASSPGTVSSSLEVLAEFLGQPGQVDRWRHRPEEAAQAADTLRRKFGIREWLVHLGAAGTVLVTDAEWWHVVPSPVLRLTYLSGSTDVVDAAYLLYRSKKQVPADALAAGVTASLFFMETNGIIPRDEEVRNHLFRAQFNTLVRPVSARGGLEEQTARAMNLLSEIRTGRGVVVVHASAFGPFSGLEEFLIRLAPSHEISASFVVWGRDETVSRIQAANPFVRIFKGDSAEEFSAYLAGLEETESVGVLGVVDAVRPLTVLLSSRGIPARVIGWNLFEILSTIGLPRDVLIQVGLEELQSDLFRVRGT